jgi:alanine-synthesizing transaminase
VIVMQEDFPRIDRLPPYVFNVVDRLKKEARARGDDIIDFGMGNPDQSTPKHIIDKLIEVVQKKGAHRYSQSSGIPRLRKAICDWYVNRYDVQLDPESQAIVTIGAKEGLSHLALALCETGDAVMVPNPTYPIHTYAFVIAGADIRHVPLAEDSDFFENLEKSIRHSWPRPKVLIINFPANPTTQCVDLEFFKKIIDFAKEHRLWVIHDLAYADLVFDGYKAPSILQVKGAEECAVEFFTVSKSYNMPGWRIGFCCGNEKLVGVLTRIKSYLDYGIFTPIQVAAIVALEGDQSCVGEICEMYRLRRDALCKGMNEIGWIVTPPKATMFVWAKIPEPFLKKGSLEFAKLLIHEAKVAVSPGIGFGEYGDQYVRFALIENKQRTRQAIRGLKQVLG